MIGDAHVSTTSNAIPDGRLAQQPLACVAMECIAHLYIEGMLDGEGGHLVLCNDPVEAVAGQLPYAALSKNPRTEGEASNGFASMYLQLLWRSGRQRVTP